MTNYYEEPEPRKECKEGCGAIATHNGFCKWHDPEYPEYNHEDKIGE